MANIYKKIIIALIATGLFIGACSKSGEKNPTPTTPTPANPNPTNPDPNPTNTTPTITSLSITSGEFDAVVLINGTNFSTTTTNNKVFFNGKAATITAATATQLTVKVPQDAGTGVITLSVNGGATVTGPTFTYVVPAPAELKIISLDTDKGIAGALVNITGTGFAANTTDNKVFFNGKAAEVTSATATMLSVRVPEGAGIGKITVTVGNKTVQGPDFYYYMSATVTTFVGSGSNAFDNEADGVGAAARLAVIACMAIDKNDNIYIVEPSSYRIRKITPDGTVTTLIKHRVVDGTKYITVDNNGNIFFAGDTDPAAVVRKLAIDGTISNYLTAAITNPPVDAAHKVEKIFFSGLATDKLGNLLIADWYHGTIYKVNDSGVNIFVAGSKDNEIKGFTANRMVLHGFCIDPNGNLYTSNSSGDPWLIPKIDAAGQITTITDKNKVFGSIKAADNKGNVYSYSYDMRITNSTGITSIVAGNMNNSDHIDGDQFAARFKSSGPMVIDRAGNIYLGQSGSIRKITLK